MAKSVKNIANRVSIIVSAFDRSGTSNHTVYGKYQSTFEVRCIYIDKENNITAYTLPANPADCVLLGLSGFFGDDRPDLVLSGINSGPNIGPNWFGSGTIGAARTSAFLGVKAIAFSGFDKVEFAPAVRQVSRVLEVCSPTKVKLVHPLGSLFWQIFQARPWNLQMTDFEAALRNH